jgi:hypothetical protein
MRLLLKLAFQSKTILFDSGGELIEIEELAKLVVGTLNSKSYISERLVDPMAIKDEYYAKNSRFEEIFTLNMNEPLLSLEHQITLSTQGQMN